nr:MAG: ORF1 [TTV-like mini virus]
MPPYRRYRRYFWRRRQPNRYLQRRPVWNRRRRFRRTFQTRWRRRRFRVRKFYKRHIKKKLKKLRLYQWQPKTIKKCKIKGYKCLFWAGPDRDSNNYAQYQETYTNPHQPGGGGWSYLIFTLDALYEEHLKCRNWWTTSNKGLPLTRYLGATFHFFRNEYTDYMVHYSLCYPMLDAPLVHANSSPYILMTTNKRFLVPSMRHKPRGKPYVKKRFHPPDILKNKWYFQADMCRSGLLLLTTAACSLSNFYIPPWGSSNCISIKTLNPKTFQKNGFINPPETTGFAPKTSTYLWAANTRETTIKLKHLSFLGRPGPYTLGTPLNNTATNTYFSNKQNWGNPFHPDVLNMNIPLFKSTQQPAAAVTEDLTKREKPISELNTTFVPVTEPLVLELRYNPDRDTGKDNYVYLQSIERDTLNFDIPADKDIQITGLPLHIAMWGWLDWQKKLAKYHQIDTSYSLVIRTPVTEPKVDYIIPVDQNFLDGKGPYGIPHSELNTYTLTSWWPKVAHQLVTNNNICHSGPATCKYEKVKAIQAHCKYSFYFKWGGCPAPMVDLTNPCSQPKYPLPDPIVQRLQIQNPETPPQLELHDFDQRQEQITKRCIERIQQYTTTEQSLSTITGPTIPPTKTTRQEIQEEIETPEEKNEKETLLLQLKQQHHQQQLLKRAIRQLMKANIE